MRTPLADDSIRKCLTRSELLSPVVMKGQMSGKTRFTCSQILILKSPSGSEFISPMISFFYLFNYYFCYKFLLQNCPRKQHSGINRKYCSDIP